MIPKIIHFCWLSDEPYPEKIQKCIDSWHKYLPDYEFIHWNYDRFPRGTSKWVDDAFDNKKYAFAADYIRLYALYNYGGIYLDTDVEVLKSFDDLLHLPYILGKENTQHGIEAAVLGAEKGAEWIKICFDHYTNRNFILESGKYDMTVLPQIMLNRIGLKYRIIDINDTNDFILDDSILCRFPIDWFSPKSWETGIITLTKNSRSIHHFTGTWLPKYRQIESAFWKKLELRDKQIIFRILKKMNLEK